MNSTIHERPGVYSSYDASSVVSASAAAKTIGAAAVATKGTANKVELITSYEEGKSVFGEDASGVYGMSTLLKFLFANGATGSGAAVSITDFGSAAGNLVVLKGYGANEVSTALATQTHSNGSTTITLADSTKITFVGVNTLSSSNFSGL